MNTAKIRKALRRLAEWCTDVWRWYWQGRRAGLVTEQDAEDYIQRLRRAIEGETLPRVAIGRVTVPGMPAAPLSPLAHQRIAEPLSSRVRAARIMPPAPLFPLAHQRMAEPLSSRVRALPPPLPPFVEGYALGGRVATRTPAVVLDTRTPIFDELVAERRARARAINMPTAEMRVVFDALTEAWRCSHCSAGDCASCPGCSCPCRLPVGAGAQ